MKAVVAAFNQEKALVGAFSVITNLRMDVFEALVPNPSLAGTARLALLSPADGSWPRPGGREAGAGAGGDGTMTDEDRCWTLRLQPLHWPNCPHCSSHHARPILPPHPPSSPVPSPG